MQTKKEKIAAISIQRSASMLDALRLMDNTFKRLLLVLDKDAFINILSIGDIQRAIIKNFGMETPVSQILRENTLVARNTDNPEFVKARMLESRIECMPILDDNGRLSDVVFWEDVFVDQDVVEVRPFSLPVVIMAGGEGTRLRPVTYVLPKALIPLGKESMLEKIINSYRKYGCNDFHISVNYKAEMIEYYIDEVYKSDIQISYIHEGKPLGTAGSLSALKGKTNSTIIVTNCDILIQNDYAAILDYHFDNKNILTVVSALKHFSIPYGIVETTEGGRLTQMLEKPEYTFQINSGMYILEPEALALIPENTFFHMTHLIEKLMAEGKKIGVFPVSEKSWIDIGNWNQYLEQNNI